MNNIEETRKRAKYLRQEAKNSPEKLIEATQCYSDLWTTYNVTNDEWDGWGYAYCLRENGDLEKALEVSKIVYEGHKDFAYNNGILANILNDKYFKMIKKDISNEDVQKLLDIAIFMGTIVLHGESPLEFCSFRALDKVKKLAIFPYSKVLQILEKLDPSKLKKDTYSIKINDREQEQASNMEKYYSYKTKALLKAKQYEECINCCTEASECISTFHYSNNVWVESRKIQAEAELGNIQLAIDKQKKLLLQKDDWFLLRDLGRLYVKDSNKSEALIYFCRAAITRGFLDKKANLYFAIGELLFENGDEFMAQKHFQFYRKVMAENGHSIPFKNQSKLFGQEDVSINELKTYWLDSIYKFLGKHTGKVIRMNQGGKSGFISFADKSIFFSTSRVISTNRLILKENDKVEFVVTSSYNKKKMIESLEANYVTIII